VVYHWIAQGEVSALPDDSGHIRVDSATLATFLAARQAAREIGIQVATIRRWVAEGDPESGEHDR